MGSQTVTDLVGRTSEQALLDGFVARTAAGTSPGAAMLLTGEPGAGKSALLGHVVKRAADSGVRVLRASGVESEAAMGFSVLQQLVLPLLDKLGALPMRHQKVLNVALGFEEGPDQVLAQVRDAAIALVRDAAWSGPLLLAVDDLQWMDGGTSAVLAALIPALRDQGTAFAGASRSADTFLRDTPASVVVVGRLCEPAAATLLARAYPDVAPPVRTSLLRMAQGNPLALLELPRPLTSGQRRGREPLPGRFRLSQRLQQMFEDRIGALPPATRRLLLLAALEPRIRIELFASMFDGASVLDIARPALRAGLVRLADDRLYPRHPLVGAAVVSAATPEDLANAHSALGQALAGRDRDLERRAWHLARATVAADESVAALLEQAAAVAKGRGDGAAGLAFLLRAADLSVEPAERVRRLARAAYFGAGVDLPLAAEIVGHLRTADPDFGRSLTAAVATAAVIAEGDGQVDMAHSLLVRAISTYANRWDPADQILLEAIGTLRWVCWLAGRAAMWADYHAALRRLRPAPPPLADLASRTSIDPARTTPQALAQIDDAIRGLPAMTDPDQIIQVTDIAYPYDRVPECRPALDRIVAIARAGRALRTGLWALLQIGLDAFHRGEWAVLPQVVGEARHLGDQSSYNVQAWPCDYEIALLAAARGDFAQAIRLADGMARWAIPRRVNTVDAYVGHVETLAAMGRGDFEGAFQSASAISPAGTFAPYAWLALNVALDLVESALRTQRPQAASAHADALAAHGIARLSPRYAMVCLACAAMVAEPAAATGLFEQALAVPRGSEWRFDHARVLLLYGSHLRRGQAVAASRAPLRQALAIFGELGARPWAARTRDELAATAERRAPAAGIGPLRRLTPQELGIAELAASGLSNKKIAERLAISPRTAGNHLYQVYTKLGIASRAGLRDALRAYSAE